jgi:hypothetical protein
VERNRKARTIRLKDVDAFRCALLLSALRTAVGARDRDDTKAGNVREDARGNRRLVVGIRERRLEHLRRRDDAGRVEVVEVGFRLVEEKDD